MHLEMWGWWVWDQSRSVDNARRASVELARARAAYLLALGGFRHPDISQWQGHVLRRCEPT